MTRIDFYIIPQDQPEQILIFACKLIEKAYSQNNKVTIKVDTSEQAETLDKLLWEFKPESFLPHKIMDIESKSDDKTIPPILITYEELGSDYEVLLNLSAEIPLAFTRFQRVIQIASQQQEQRNTSREQYKFYKDRGYPMFNHDLRK